jgi:hypothetical protein
MSARPGTLSLTRPVVKALRPLLVEEDLAEVDGEAAGEDVERRARDHLVRLEVDAGEGVEEREDHARRDARQEAVCSPRRA